MIDNSSHKQGLSGLSFQSGSCYSSQQAPEKENVCRVQG